ncbi:MAG: sigma-70 family RNA polymerase sigma factor [Planctomycetia bacterium]
MPSPHAVRHDIADALQAWQESGDEVWLEYLISRALPRLEHAARSVLRRLHISDWSAVDDALSLVFDHLRRLPATTPGERAVRRFETGRGTGHGSGDQGLAYLVWLAHERAIDVARQRKRQATRHRLFATAHHTPRIVSTDHEALSDTGEADCASAARLHAALAMLEPRARAVIQLLLDGKSQAVIAHVLGVCEGTVSRLRTRAITELRRLLA